MLGFFLNTINPVSLYRTIKKSVLDFKKFPLLSVGKLLLVLSVLTVFVSFTVSVVLCFTNRHFANQVYAISQFEFKNAFTLAAVQIYFNQYTMVLLAIVWFVTFLALCIHWIMQEVYLINKITLFTLFGSGPLLVALLFIASRGVITIPDSSGGTMPILTLNDAINYRHLLSGFSKVFAVSIVAVAGLFLISMIGTFVSLLRYYGSAPEGDEEPQKLLTSIVLACALAPLLLLAISNILPLVVIVILTVIAAFLVLSSIGGEGSRAEGSSAGSASAKVPPAKQGGGSSSGKPKPAQKDTPKPAPKVKDYMTGTTFKRKVGAMGYCYIEYENLYSLGYEACSQEDFDTGKVILTVNGKRVTGI